MFLTRGDAHANSRRWLTPRRDSLYSDDDHISPITFFLEPRRDQETYQPDKLHACPLLAESYRNNIKANSGIRSQRLYRSSTRLPVFGSVARVALCGVFVWAPDGTRACSAFWQMDDSELSFCRRGAYESFTTYVLRSIAVSPQPGWLQYTMPSTTARGYVSCEDERMSGNAMERGARW